MVRAVRLAATLEFDIEPATLAAIAANAELVGHLSGERIGAELEKLLAAPRPSAGLRLARPPASSRSSRRSSRPSRASRRTSSPARTLGPHAAHRRRRAGRRPIVRLAALLHDIGKPSTRADGRFPHHETAVAALADELLRRLRYPRSAAEEVVHLVRHHMFTVDPDPTDAAVRRFIKRVGRERLDALFALRRADDIGSGMPPDDTDTLAFRARIEAELDAQVPLDRNALAMDGTDLIASWTWSRARASAA